MTPVYADVQVVSNGSKFTYHMVLSVRSGIQPVDPSQVPLWVSEMTLDQYFQVAIVTILVYDTMTTMDKEVKYFWKTPRKTVNIVYFANRYVGLLGAVAHLFFGSYSATLPLCNFATWTQEIVTWITIILIDYILMVRVLALYSQDRVLSLCLKALLALEAAFKLGILIYVILVADIAVCGLAEGVTVCTAESISPWQWVLVNLIIPMVYGVIFMVLALYKATEFWRISAGFKGFTLVKVLIEDQVIYFILVVACSVINILQHLLKISNPFVSIILQSLGSPSFLCVLGSRMLVNLKEAGERGLNEGTSYRMKSMSEMEFS